MREKSLWLDSLAAHGVAEEIQGVAMMIVAAVAVAGADHRKAVLRSPKSTSLSDVDRTSFAF